MNRTNTTLFAARRSQHGMTLLEVIVALSVAAIVLMGTLYAISAMSAAADCNHEMMIAVNAARQKLTEIQNASFTTAFAQFGPGANSNSFTVSALNNGTGTFVFPVSASGNLDETMTDANLGMPQDLNGNGNATESNVSASYKILPVRIRVSWSSAMGNREINLNTMLVQLR